MDLGPVIGSENTCKVAEPSIKETFVFAGGDFAVLEWEFSVG